MKRLKDKTHRVCTITIEQVRKVYKEGFTTSFEHDRFLVHIKTIDGGIGFSSARACQMWAKIIQEAKALANP